MCRRDSLGDEHLVTGADDEPRRRPVAASIGASIGAGGRHTGARSPASPATGGGVGERVGDQVDGLGRVAGEDDLVGPGADEGGDPGARRLVGVGAFFGELVSTPVDRRVGAFVEVTLGVEHLARLVGGRAGVEVDQRVAVTDGAREDREVGPDAGRLRVGERIDGHGLSLIHI